MTVISFGSTQSHATIFYDRSVKICCIIANAEEHLAEAVAVASAMKVDKIIVVAPKVSMALIPALRESQDLIVYEL